MATLKERAQHYCDILNFIIWKVQADKKMIAEEATKKVRLNKQSNKDIEIKWNELRGVFQVGKESEEKPIESKSEFASMDNTKFY
jgi:hypothetical protein